MVYSTFDIESQHWNNGTQLICGVDEVGRGCFAGPVVAGAVIFPKNFVGIEGVADSKLLKADKREILTQTIKDKALCWALGEASVEEINKLGIGKATQVAFKRAVEALSNNPDLILIDAFFIEGIDKERQIPIIGGDRLSSSIAAASIIAKVYRDDLMTKLDINYPQFGFSKHKGYGTKAHREAIKAHGLCELHRTSFNLNKFL